MGSPAVGILRVIPTKLLIAVDPFLVNRKAFAFQTDFGSVLGFRFYFQFYLGEDYINDPEDEINYPPEIFDFLAD